MNRLGYGAILTGLGFWGLTAISLQCEIGSRQSVIERIPQRTETDCAICAVAMVMGRPYSYERVLRDSRKHPHVLENGKFHAWWEPYLRAEGFRAVYRPFLDLYDLPRFRGRVVGLLGMTITHMNMRHIVAVDELGIIDPVDNAPDHIEIGEYVLSRKQQGFNIDIDFLAVERKKSFGAWLWMQIVARNFKTLFA